ETIIYPATYQGAHNVCATPDGETIFVGDEIGSGPWTRAFDVSDLSDPELIAELIVDDQAVVHNCYVEGDLLYVAHYTEGLQVFDVSTPASPEQVAFYDTRPGPGFGFDGAWTAYPYLPSGRVIVSDLSGGLFVIRADVGAARLSARATTPLAIAPGGAVSFDYTVANLQAGPLTGDLYFVAERNGTVVAQDLITSGTLPAGQTVGGTFTQPVSSDTPAGTYAYSLRVGQFPGVAVDLSTFPLVVGAAGAPAGAAEAWTVTDATPWSGEAPAVRSEAPSAAPSVAAFPNPFGDAVTLRFTLPEAAAVRLAVYDVLGREVAVLAEGPRAAGVHEAVLDGRGLAAGGYVWHLEAAGAVQTGRLVLTR
ncbi:MAG: choice-of-anchor B family protein, partial [Bacteroidota bacterium]